MIIAILALVIIILYSVSIRRYKDVIMLLPRKEYVLRNFLSIGFYILDEIGYKYKTQYDKVLISKITEIYGANNADLYLKVHWSNKILTIIALMFVIALIETQYEAKPVDIIFVLLFLVGTILLHDRELDKKVKKRRLSIQLDFPDFANKLALLVNAGLTVRKSWEKIDKENMKDSDFYKEIRLVNTEIASGKPELRAYEDFARRCRLSEVARFVTLIFQNIKKGNEELVPILRVLSNESWEIRKNTAKKLGEEASTKMVVPLIFIFIAILIILGTPAIIAISKV
jgi:tight adherence protein C